MGVPEGEERKKTELFEAVMTENFPPKNVIQQSTAIAKWLFFAISFSDNSLLTYSNVADLWTSIFYSEILFLVAFLWSL